jgi:hypothetical protein
MEYVIKKRPYICTAKLRNIQTFAEYWIRYTLYNAILTFYSCASNGIVALYEVSGRLTPGGPRIGWGLIPTWRTAVEKFAMSAPVPLDSSMRLCRPSWRRNRAKNQAGWGGFVAPDLARCGHSDPERIAYRDPMAARRA